ncbi:hypothetical protein FA15DRAFT_622014 [Coprinopsis marcescibilis]|uniref:DUF6533 domain-containing protein n=1 Tax=Coprinopsis marcescibilis TaxID=230819 RepID=A0A5C3L3M2_COPMA|nr:hypothetical protein FA15DRAFT_622014 [Coprinopsis marcescibilis]
MDEAATSNDVFFARKTVSYMNVASACIMFYEHIITLDEEFMSIWQARWTVSKVLYILMKYSGFVQVGIILWQQTYEPAPGDTSCLVSFHITAWLIVISIGVGELLLSVRTWAVWKKPRLMGGLLLLFWLAAWGAIFAILAIFLQTVRFDHVPNAPFTGCFITFGNPIFFLDWLILLVYDTVMLVLILIPAYKAYKAGGSSQFVRAVYKDGIIYYVYLFALSALNILVVVKLPFDLSTLLTQMERVLHAVLTGRVVLHIHSLSRSNEYDSVTSAPRLSNNDHVVMVPVSSTYRRKSLHVQGPQTSIHVKTEY